MAYTQEKISAVVRAQREYFRTGETLDVKFRVAQLKKLKQAVIEREEELEKALYEDLGKSKAEAYLCDVGPVIVEINEILRGIKKWARPEKHFSGLHCFPSLFTRVYKMPYGVTLIISPFNFPILLTLGVLAASISGGNTAVLKVSSKSKACSEALQKLIAGTFPEEYVTVIDGGHDIADMCLEERFDKIFYTGSPRVAVHVLEMAAKHLTPVALELGGETGNWCVIRKDADLKDAARKIAFFKMLNSGQICININQVAVAEEAADEFIRELKAAFSGQIGENAAANPEYPKLISAKAYETCAKEAEQYRERIVYGGYGDPETRKYSPTIIYPVRPDESIVRHELFNPLLPVVPFRDAEADELMDLIAKREHGLALYLFTRNKKWARKVMSSQQYGGGCINDTIVHVSSHYLPFGGVGNSGMGSYHGYYSFRTFTHEKSVILGSSKVDIPIRYAPFDLAKWKLVKKLL